ncbi:hypothetical protein MTR_1g071330 [Medicago truncatula]|uniref:Uncharacterized protein n=1 Tax=Medicago truncatula TaxID=3880 RepID=G7ICR9_MEDTR|nr:hypothetical protein MTR_1g071330 [Medicago truncatula]
MMMRAENLAIEEPVNDVWPAWHGDQLLLLSLFHFHSSSVSLCMQNITELS